MQAFLLLPLLVSPASQEGGGGSLAYVPASNGLDAIAFEGGNTEFELGDVNDDGHLDLLSIGDHGNPLIGSGEQGIIVFLGDGAGNWTLVQGGDFGYGGIALGDVNGDGLLDVGYGMHHNYASDDLGDQLLEVALGDGTGAGWTPWDDGLATNGETWGMFATDFADVDNDGRLDVLSNSFGCCAGAHVYRNEGDGTWTQTFGFLGGNATHFATFGDIDGDGNADFAVGNDTGNVWRGDGAGGFVCVDGNLPGTAYSRVGFDFGDVDGDGRDEYAFRNTGGALEVWSHAGGATWTSLSSGLPTASGYEIVQLADMDADGSRDLLAAGGGQVAVFRRVAGQWTLAVEGTIQPGADAVALRTGLDVDHNGRPDFALFQDEGCGFFCSQNRLHFFREASVPAALEAFVAYPRGGEVWRAGSVRTIEWFSAVPGGAASSVDVRLSTRGPNGPWRLLAAGTPNDGQLQIRLPRALDSRDCWVQVIATAGADVAVATNPAAFTILPAPPRPARRAPGATPR